jgi:hypothetical protein
MKDKVENLKREISVLAQDESFIHHEWYLDQHLEIVEQLSLEISKNYEPDMDLVLSLVWIHDYAKTVGIRDDKEVISRSRSFLLELGFEEEYIDKLINLLEIFERKEPEELRNSPIEVQIVSTADGASHMIGTFYQRYVYENPDVPFDELMESNLRKLDKDWNRKIVLPEVKEKLQERYDFLRESFGEIPERILS